jgi:hypothetical protein
MAERAGDFCTLSSHVDALERAQRANYTSGNQQEP